MSAFLRFFRGKTTVRGATGLLAITLTLSNVLGVVRDRLLAAKIPAGELDSYFAAFRLPDFLTNLIVVGAIGVVFIPIFTQLRAKDEQEAWRAASAILNTMLIILVIGSVFLWVFMPNLMPLLVPDFDAAKLAQTVLLARLFSLTPIIFGISYLLSGILNSFHRFTVYAFAPLVYNLSIIAGTLFFADRFGVFGVVGGVLVGALLHMLIQLPVALFLGWHWQAKESFRHPVVQKVAQLMMPRLVGLGAIQFILLTATSIASMWPGAITYYTLANNIQTMPTVVFANSIATAIFPTIALAVAQGNHKEYRRHIAQGIRWIIFLLVPATVTFVLLRIQIVRIILGAGHFGWEQTQATADVLGWFSLSLVATGLIPLLARAFYAHQDMRTPMKNAVIGASVTIILSYLLSRLLPAIITFGPSYSLYVGEAASLAIAFSAGMMIYAIGLYIDLNRMVKLPTRELEQSFGRVLVAGLVMAVAVQIAKVVFGSILDLQFGIGILVQFLGSFIVGILAFVGMVAWMKCPEWIEIKKLIQKKVSIESSTDAT